MSATQHPGCWFKPLSCSGSCDQGRQVCDCVPDVETVEPPIRPIRSVEEEHPIVWLLYGVAFLAAIGICLWKALA